MSESVIRIEEWLAPLMQSVIEGQVSRTVELTRAAIDTGVPPGQILNQALIPAMNEVGRLMESNEYYIPEVLVSAKATKQALEILKPLMAEAINARPLGTVVIGTVSGDLHDIGKNLVAIMLEGSGFKVIDLGVDVPPERFVEAAKGNRANLVAMSALLTTTMLNMRRVVQALAEAGLRDQVRVIIGGAPVEAKFATEIGADGYAPNAAAGAKLASRLLESSRPIRQ